MAQISISRTHLLGPEGARNAADRVAADLREEHGLRTHWEGNVLMVHGKGIHGTLTVTENLVEVRVKLGMAMSFFRSALEREINSELNEHLGN